MTTKEFSYSVITPVRDEEEHIRSTIECMIKQTLLPKEWVIVDDGSKDVRLTIVVTGGEEKKPIDSASVYVRYVEEHKHGRDKKIEMNLKTNQSGVCHVPVIPPGKFLVQVIAEGWKTYGEYYDISQTEQTINITLVRPPTWY